MKVKLITRCGCTRFININGDELKEFIEMALFPDLTIPFVAIDEIIETKVYRRTFKYHDERNGIPIYLEEMIKEG